MRESTLAMIHGLVGSLSYFGPGKRILRANVRACDLLGYGVFRESSTDRLTLYAQADHVTHIIADWDIAPVWLLGHSMGGAVAMLLADRHPDLVAGIINVEGNFTLKDAFWSRKIVEKEPARWEEEYGLMQADIPAWLQRCRIASAPQRERWAAEVLAWQPASTVYAMSQAIMTETTDPGYLEAVRRVLDSGLPVDLIAGEKSAADWDVPDFVRATARSYIEQPEVGHLMMLEAPDEFCRIVDTCLSHGT